MKKKEPNQGNVWMVEGPGTPWLNSTYVNVGEKVHSLHQTLKDTMSQNKIKNHNFRDWNSPRMVLFHGERDKIGGAQPIPTGAEF